MANSAVGVDVDTKLTTMNGYGRTARMRSRKTTQVMVLASLFASCLSVSW